ncbi:aryl-sulfate sulfotransferase [Lacinutrix sp.]|uniref:aryl-sulfate sulfotransferase n=2 Tax=Lacinutrix sp. TaxID=1937692 RepID=UPI002611E8B1|nr:aryl-sulfate sulfotransferase [Lacinutrix sp.]MDG1715712.1 aryl-sulfate sulfotransferase [Lacinutrix sp.]
MRTLILFLCCFLTTTLMLGQNTVGTLRNDLGSYDAYTLLSPINSTETYLLNNCGQVVHQWTSTYTPGASVYLLENGNLLRTGKIANNNFQFGGVGGKIELFDWDNNLIWEYTYTDSTYTQHHDIYPLPNGNILMIVATVMTEAEALQAGRNPANLTQGEVFNEQILEIQPFGTNQANVVWEWNIKDHLVQDFDATKDNFGVVADNPNRLDFNYINATNATANWLHCNSLQYNPALDQLVLSSRIMSEIYIIDHSTTTAEAATSTGGTYGKGGDFLYRWGNKAAYDKGTSSNQTLFGQHYPHWIADGLTDAGKIMIFNNGGARAYSSIDIIDPMVTTPGNYTYDNVNGYGPTNAEWIYTTPTNTDFFTAILSSGERLPNGNTLICDGDSGYFFEIDPAENIVWEYVNPDATNGIINQGDTASFNLVFRAHKFSFDYPAFTGKNLTPGDPIETNPDISNCNLLNVTENVLDENSIKLFPNPVVDYLTIEYTKSISSIEVYTIFGQLLSKVTDTKTIKFGNMASGFYLIRVNSEEGSITKKILKQ